ncbi:hypothetical protein QE152_g39328 [Popillia japonica]|uniref:Uncharacterized protein n=1 Tax=Popillia japonica TaxID=7064 RepID=A0AAW1HUE9_POPJA
MEGKTYYLLGTIKKKVNSSELRVDLSDVGQTKKEEVLIAVRNGSDKVDILKREITGKLPDASTTTLVDKKILHIKGLDEVTTVEEVAEAIIWETSAASNSFTVRALRPVFGNKQNVTVTIAAAHADRLLQAGKIKIGWMKCTIYEGERETECF